MTDRNQHPRNCACCTAYGSSLDLFARTRPDGQIDLFLDGLMQAVAHIAAAQTKPDCIQQQRDALQSRIAEMYDFYCVETGAVVRQ